MSHYRRLYVPGGTYFFTLRTYRHQQILCSPEVRGALRSAIVRVRAERPFTIDAWVLLPDHMHCIWTLPVGDSDFPGRWLAIKRMVSIACRSNLRRAEWMNRSKCNQAESTLWQRRYWEHLIRNARDLERHMDYIHFNPVKHGYVASAGDWAYSSFHRHVRCGLYAADWGASEAVMGVEWE